MNPLARLFTACLLIPCMTAEPIGAAGISGLQNLSCIGSIDVPLEKSLWINAQAVTQPTFSGTLVRAGARFKWMTSRLLKPSRWFQGRSKDLQDSADVAYLSGSHDRPGDGEAPPRTYVPNQILRRDANPPPPLLTNEKGERFYYRHQALPRPLRRWHDALLVAVDADHTNIPRTLLTRPLSDGSTFTAWQSYGASIYLGVESAGICLPLLWLEIVGGVVEAVYVMAPDKHVAWMLQELLGKPDLRAISGQILRTIFPRGLPLQQAPAFRPATAERIASVAQKIRRATVAIIGEAGVGSGTIYLFNGRFYIATAAHNLEGRDYNTITAEEGLRHVQSSRYWVRFAHGGRQLVSPITYDWGRDLAILALDALPAEAAALDIGWLPRIPKRRWAGEPVLKAGYPKALGFALAWDWSSGLTMLKSIREKSYVGLSLWSRSVPGMSGGAVVNIRMGKLVGIITSSWSNNSMAVAMTSWLVLQQFLFHRIVSDARDHGRLSPTSG